MRLEQSSVDAVYETTALLSLTSQIITDGELSDQAVEDINCLLDGAQKRLCLALLDMERNVNEA